MNNLDHYFNFLNSITVFTAEDFEKSKPYFKYIDLQKGALWIEQNKVCREVAFVEKGMLRSYYTDHQGNEVTSCFCIENTISSSFKSFVSQQPSEISVQALESTTLFAIEYNHLNTLYKTVSIWQEISRLLIEKEYLSMFSYASSLNTEVAKAKYLRLLAEQPTVLQKAEVQHIASYLGVSRETLSRIRKQVATKIM